MHGARIALFGSQLVISLGLRQIAGNADTLLVEIADPVLRRGEAAFCCKIVPLGGFGVVALDAAPVHVAAANFEKRLAVALCCRFAQWLRPGFQPEWPEWPWHGFSSGQVTGDGVASIVDGVFAAWRSRFPHCRGGL